MNTYIKYTYRLFNMKSIKHFFNKLIQGNVLMTPTGIIPMNFNLWKQYYYLFFLELYYYQLRKLIITIIETISETQYNTIIKSST